ncbi:post-transcriptional regulator [Bacillus sp. MUM 116]|uniref:post-transcriptional regulator n=1 Tax=Bacillus sp. MUM 116 TaxID=1678002 RepID=UPI0008F573FE|nr:post-transcriptional regulator [Bacillus sp. MUM 116]OIK17003.1 post-transcriptional regulator [Bacillus sp. MUM 116]
MENRHAYDHFRSQVKPALTSKLTEFQILGYNSVTENGLWEFLQKKKWKKVKDEIYLHEIIQDILAVKVSDYMSFATIEAYKSADFSLEDENAWKELLK